MSGFLHTWGWSVIALAIWLPGWYLIHGLFRGDLFKGSESGSEPVVRPCTCATCNTRLPEEWKP